MEKLKRRSAAEDENSEEFNPTKPDWDFVTSTGSTLIDLAISGKRLPFGGVPSGILMEVAGESQSGKCVSRNNFITCADGTYTVDEFFDNVGFPAFKAVKTILLEKDVFLPNMFGREEKVKALTFNGLRIIKKITAANGMMHEVTLNHPLKVITKNGNMVWKHASNIERGEFLVIKANTTRNSTAEESLLCKEAYVAGLWVADGYLAGTASFTNNEVFLLKKVTDFLDSNRIKYRVRDRIKNGRYSTTCVSLTSVSGSDKLRSLLGLTKAKSADKSVPLKYRTSGREVAISFLRGFFDCEAYFGTGMEVVSASKTLLMQIQQMLCGIGIVSSIKPKKVNSYPDTEYWRLSFSGTNYENFLEIVGTSLLSRKEQASKNRKIELKDTSYIPFQTNNMRDFVSDVFKGGMTRKEAALVGPQDRNLTKVKVLEYRQYFKRNGIVLSGWSAETFAQWENFALNDYHFTEVTGAEILPEEDWTYDVSMSETASFLLNGCVSHNTLILTEMAARIQNRGGSVFFADPEDRLDKEYASITGLNIKDQGQYERPDTVTELFDYFNNWEVDPTKMNIFCGDSLAALSTKMEMEDGDKMGMRRAKEFSEELRKCCRMFKKKNTLMVCSNQIRDGGPNGKKTIPGGNAVPFYSTVRLKMSPGYPKSKIKKEKTIKGAKHEKVIGVQSLVTVHKNSLDDPWRKVPLYIIFGYGIDDIRANLHWYKESTNSKKFIVPGGIELATIDKAIEYVEETNLAKKLRIEVRDLWLEIENQFKQNRKPKEF